MLKILKNLKQSWLSVVIIILLLCIQASVDLELPNYTSKIVNEGIQSGGIEDAVPNIITYKDMETILFFSEDDEKILENSFCLFSSCFAIFFSSFVRIRSHSLRRISQPSACKINPFLPDISYILLILPSPFRNSDMI